MKKPIILMLLITLCVTGCIRESVLNPVEYQPFIIPSATRIVDDIDWTSYFDAQASGDSTYIADIALYDKYKFQAKQLLAVGEGAGLLKIITGVEKQDDVIAIYVDSTSLTSAMQRGHGHWQSRLSDVEEATIVYKHNDVDVSQQPPAVVLDFDTIIDDADQDTSTKNDQVSLQGSLRLDGLFDFDFDVDNHAFNRCDWESDVNQELSLTFRTTHACNITREIRLTTMQYHGIVFSADRLPVTVAPRVTIWLGVDGYTNSAATATVDHQAFMKAGLQLATAGDWVPYSDFHNIYTYNKPTVGTDAAITSYIKIRIEFPFYQQTGPYITSILSHELFGYNSSSRRWEIYLSARAEVGIQAAILQSSLENFSRADVVTYRKKIGQGS